MSSISTVNKLIFITVTFFVVTVLFGCERSKPIYPYHAFQGPYKESMRDEIKTAISKLAVKYKLRLSEHDSRVLGRDGVEGLGLALYYNDKIIVDILYFPRFTDIYLDIYKHKNIPQDKTELISKDFKTTLENILETSFQKSDPSKSKRMIYY